MEEGFDACRILASVKSFCCRLCVDFRLSADVADFFRPLDAFSAGLVSDIPSNSPTGWLFVAHAASVPVFHHHRFETLQAVVRKTEAADSGSR